MNFKHKIEQSLNRAVSNLGFQFEAVKLEHPAEALYGDYSSNIALVVHGQKEVYKTPREGAEAIVQELQKDHLLGEVVEKVDVAGPGFINFWLKTQVLVGELQEVLEKGKNYGKADLASQDVLLRGKKVMVEYTDQNPFKELHIGHLYSNIIGESISRLFENEGALVARAIYQGDIGLHVAKAVWGMRELFKKESSLKEVEKKDPKERVTFLGKAYALGADKYVKSKKAKQEIIKINQQIFAADPAILDLYKTGRKWSLEDFERIYKRLGTKFDYYYLESEVGEAGLNLVKEYLEKGVFQKSDGAVIFPGEKFGLHNRVFINSLGLPTYEAKELGLAPAKYKDFPYDLSIIVTGNDIKEYFRVLILALSQIYPKLSEKTRHIPHGMVRLPGGKMSSRTGKVLTAEWLLDTAKNKLHKSYPEMVEETTDKVALAGVKYALLRSSIGSDLIFDLDKSLSFDGDSGPYLQYTFARTQSVLEGAGNQVSGVRLSDNQQPENLNEEELVILKHIYKFPEVLKEAVYQFAPNLVCNFLFELAQKYNTFYSKHRIIGDQASGVRLALTSATGIVLKSGLNILGIEAPERM